MQKTAMTSLLTRHIPADHELFPVVDQSD